MQFCGWCTIEDDLRLDLAHYVYAHVILVLQRLVASSGDLRYVLGQTTMLC